MAMVGGERSGTKSAEPTADEYKDLLKETLATACKLSNYYQIRKY